MTPVQLRERRIAQHAMRREDAQVADLLADQQVAAIHVEIMEGAGIARPDIAALFDIVIRGLRSPVARPPLPTPEIPNGFVLVRNDVLMSLAAGMPVSAPESTDAP